MIRPEDMRRGPVMPDDGFPPETSQSEVANALNNKIANIAKLTKQRVVFGPPDRGDHLFSFKAEQPLVDVTDIRSKSIGSIDPTSIQEIALTQMQKFGLDLDDFKTTWDMSFPNGTTREIRAYWSRTVPGLVFERDIKRYTTSGAPIEVSWSVHDKTRRAGILEAVTGWLNQL